MSQATPAPSPLSYLWQVPGKRIAVNLRLDLIDRLGVSVGEGFQALPRRGLETGGLLFGGTKRKGDLTTVQIAHFEPIECEHAVGPSYLLSATDRRRLEERIRRHKSNGGLPIVGFYRGHTRKEFGITVEDADLMSWYFSDSANVFLLIQAHRDRPPTAGFAIWESRKIASTKPYLEFPFQSDALLAGEHKIQPWGEGAAAVKAPAVPPSAERSRLRVTSALTEAAGARLESPRRPAPVAPPMPNMQQPAIPVQARSDTPEAPAPPVVVPPPIPVTHAPAMPVQGKADTPVAPAQPVVVPLPIPVTQASAMPVQAKANTPGAPVPPVAVPLSIPMTQSPAIPVQAKAKTPVAPAPPVTVPLPIPVTHAPAIAALPKPAMPVEARKHMAPPAPPTPEKLRPVLPTLPQVVSQSIEAGRPNLLQRANQWKMPRPSMDWRGWAQGRTWLREQQSAALAQMRRAAQWKPPRPWEQWRGRIHVRSWLVVQRSAALAQARTRVQRAVQWKMPRPHIEWRRWMPAHSLPTHSPLRLGSWPMFRWRPNWHAVQIPVRLRMGVRRAVTLPGEDFRKASAGTRRISKQLAGSLRGHSREMAMTGLAAAALFFVAALMVNVDRAPAPIAIDRHAGQNPAVSTTPQEATASAEPLIAKAATVVEPPVPIAAGRPRRTGRSDRTVARRSLEPSAYEAPAPAPASAPTIPDPPAVAESIPPRGVAVAVRESEIVNAQASQLADPFVQVAVDPLPEQRNAGFLYRLSHFGKNKREPFVPPKAVRQAATHVAPERRNRTRRPVRVDVKVYVDPAGRVEYAELVSGGKGDDRDLATLAVFSSRHWQFSPAYVGEEAVPAEVILRYRFGPETN
ncbi:MAG TPA: hypothetical protein VGF59_37580 [Bryobacteraceae bacterium]